MAISQEEKWYPTILRVICLYNIWNNVLKHGPTFARYVEILHKRWRHQRYLQLWVARRKLRRFLAGCYCCVWCGEKLLRDVIVYSKQKLSWTFEQQISRSSSVVLRTYVLLCHFLANPASNGHTLEANCYCHIAYWLPTPYISVLLPFNRGWAKTYDVISYYLPTFWKRKLRNQNVASLLVSKV